MPKLGKYSCSRKPTVDSNTGQKTADLSGFNTPRKRPMPPKKTYKPNRSGGFARG